MCAYVYTYILTHSIQLDAKSTRITVQKYLATIKHIITASSEVRRNQSNNYADATKQHACW